MLSISIEKRAQKYLRSIQKKHVHQIVTKLYELRHDPEPSDSKMLKNSEYRRADIGEHRIIYLVIKNTLIVPLIGKRNDDEVYRRLRRLEG